MGTRRGEGEQKLFHFVASPTAHTLDLLASWTASQIDDRIPSA
jgi:hypothetical protein